MQLALNDTIRRRLCHCVAALCGPLRLPDMLRPGIHHLQARVSIHNMMHCNLKHWRHGFESIGMTYCCNTDWTCVWRCDLLLCMGDAS